MNEITLCGAWLKYFAYVVKTESFFTRNPHPTTVAVQYYQMTKFWTIEGEWKCGEAVVGQSW